VQYGDAVARIAAELKREENPHGFLAAGENALFAATDEYAGALGITAIENSRLRNGSAVDKGDVKIAVRLLRGDVEAERRSWLLALAGFAGGAAVAAITAFLLADKPVHHGGYWKTGIALLALVSVTLFIASYPSRKRY
jgi:hypothetical protein